MPRGFDAGPLDRRRALAVVLAGLLLASGTPALAKNFGPDVPAVLPIQKPEPAFPLNEEWTLAELNGKPVGGDQPSFTLDDKMRATGFAGCNTYSMTLFPGRGQKLLAGSIARTRNTCDKAALQLETTFLIALHSVPLWRLENGDLIITSHGTILRFRRGI